MRECPRINKHYWRLEWTNPNMPRVDKISRWLDISSHLVFCGLFEFSGKIKLKNKHRRNILDLIKSAILTPSTFCIRERELVKFRYFLWSVDKSREVIREMVQFLVSQQSPCMQTLLMEKYDHHWRDFCPDSKLKFPILSKWMDHGVSSIEARTEQLNVDVRFAYEMNQANHADLEIIRTGFILREIRAPHHMYVRAMQSFACMDCKKIRVKYIYNDALDVYYCPKSVSHRLTPVCFSGNIVEFYGKVYIMCIRCGGEFVESTHKYLCNTCTSSVSNSTLLMQNGERDITTITLTETWKKEELRCDICGIARKKNSKKKWNSIKIFNHPNYLKRRALLCHLEKNIKHKDAYWSWPILLEELKSSGR